MTAATCGHACNVLELPLVADRLTIATDALASNWVQLLLVHNRELGRFKLAMRKLLVEITSVSRPYMQT